MHSEWQVVLDDCEDAMNRIDGWSKPGTRVGWERFLLYLTSAVQLASSPAASATALRSSLVDLAAICLMWAKRL